jgi:anti-sigma factor RsiW
MHSVWKGLIEAYTEGRLRWPLTRMVEMHTAGCQECRHELRMQRALWRKIDSVLFSREEMAKTAALAVEKSLEQPAHMHLRLPSVVLGTALIVIVLAFIPGRWQPWLGPAARTVAASSSWGEGVATSVLISKGEPADTGSAFSHSSGTGQGTGVPAAAYVVGEWGG